MAKLEQAVVGVGFLMVSILFAYGTKVCLSEDTCTNSIAVIVLYSGLAVLPALAVLYRRHVRITTYQQAQLEAQKSYIAAMRAQRHDIINELTLVSAYIQMNDLEKAKQCIAFIGADLSEKYNYVTLPKDAWLTIMELKRREARERGVHFGVVLRSAPPTDTDEQRLLPKLVANLADNAIEASARADKPWVKLEWGMVGDHRVLSIKNNGPMISPEMVEKLFEPGYSSKEGEGHGWGLAICRRIAKELGGELEVKSTPEVTEFALILPQAPGQVQSIGEALVHEYGSVAPPIVM